MRTNLCRHYNSILYGYFNLGFEVDTITQCACISEQL